MTSGGWVPFEYRDFYDVPRMILVRRVDRAFLFDSPFDERADEYSDAFYVYRLSLASADELRAQSSWRDATALGTLAATVPVADVEFDPSRRQSISESVFERYEIK
jgi:hypothetical protein